MGDPKCQAWTCYTLWMLCLGPPSCLPTGQLLYPRSLLLALIPLDKEDASALPEPPHAAQCLCVSEILAGRSGFSMSCLLPIWHAEPGHSPRSYPVKSRWSVRVQFPHLILKGMWETWAILSVFHSSFQEPLNLVSLRQASPPLFGATSSLSCRRDHYGEEQSSLV